MNIPPKYEDLVFQLNELNKREAALREELDALRESYEAMRDRKNSIVDLQQRLTVAEQLLSRALKYGGMTPDWRDSVEEALKTDAEGEES